TATGCSTPRWRAPRSWRRCTGRTSRASNADCTRSCSRRWRRRRSAPRSAADGWTRSITGRAAMAPESPGPGGVPPRSGTRAPAGTGDWFEDWLDAHRGDLSTWRRHIHRNPELSRQEFRTTAFVAERLRTAGLDPQVLPGGTGL